MDKCNIVVVGATGAVGKVALQLLEERMFPCDTIRLCASERSAGKRLQVQGKDLVVEATTSESFKGMDIAFISVSADVSRELVPLAVQAGTVVIDDSSAFRMDPSVPLVVPEVNADDLEEHQGVISIPNCSTTPLVMALNPLHKENPIKRVVVDTYQSVSGTGVLAIEELNRQSQEVLDQKPAQSKVYPHQIAFNVLPHVEGFQINGYTAEEMKMLNETRKIMHAPALNVSATCARVPVYLSHSEAVHVEFSESMEPEDVRTILGKCPGVKVLDDPNENVYPMPWSVGGTDDVYVGRIRRDISCPNGLVMWLVSDNLRKGAALNALQIAEELLKRNLVPNRKNSSTR